MLSLEPTLMGIVATLQLWCAWLFIKAIIKFWKDSKK
jgi:hypothetical protein